MAFINEMHNLQAKINIRNTIIAMLVLFAMLLFLLLVTYPNRLVVDFPPDPRITQSVKPGYKYPSTVHAFAAMIFQYLNTWETNGEKDYRDRRNMLRAYMTPFFYKAAQADFQDKLKKGELKGRSRAVQLADGYLFRSDFVTVKDGSWIVTLVFDLEERVFGQIVKAARIEYKIEVVRYNVNPEKNAYQLALAGFAAEPRVIDRGKK